jgi:hypothetical protein
MGVIFKAIKCLVLFLFLAFIMAIFIIFIKSQFLCHIFNSDDDNRRKWKKNLQFITVIPSRETRDTYIDTGESVNRARNYRGFRKSLQPHVDKLEDYLLNFSHGDKNDKEPPSSYHASVEGFDFTSGLPVLKDDETSPLYVVWIHAGFSGVTPGIPKFNKMLGGHAVPLSFTMMRFLLLRSTVPGIIFRFPTDDLSTLNLGGPDDVWCVDMVIREIHRQRPNARLAIVSECLGGLRLHRWFHSQLIKQDPILKCIAALFYDAPLLNMEYGVLGAMLPDILFPCCRIFFNLVIPKLNIEYDRTQSKLAFQFPKECMSKNCPPKILEAEAEKEVEAETEMQEQDDKQEEKEKEKEKKQQYPIVVISGAETDTFHDSHAFNAYLKYYLKLNPDNIHAVYHSAYHGFSFTDSRFAVVFHNIIDSLRNQVST